MNIIGYAKRYKDKTFFEEPFNVVDSLIFAEMAYINFAEEVKDDDFVALKDINVTSQKKFYLSSYDALNNRKLFNLVKGAERFKEVKVGFCHALDDTKTQTQFYAMTFILPTGEAYISYRGTDVTINGIKEDLLIAYQDYIPGSLSAMDYLNRAVSLFSGNFYLGGHSKGGNLAAITALGMDKNLATRLIKAYSFDGPGTQKEIEDFENWEYVLPKIEKYLTSNDMVGVVYNKIKDAKIVYSTGLVLGGHDLFKWQVNEKVPDFIYTKSRSIISRSHEEALTNWLVTIPQYEKKLAVELLSEFMGESKTPADMLLKATKNLSSGRNKWNSYTIEEKNRTKEIFKQLGKYYIFAYSPKSLIAKHRETRDEKEDQ